MAIKDYIAHTCVTDYKGVYNMMKLKNSYKIKHKWIKSKVIALCELKRIQKKILGTSRYYLWKLRKFKKNAKTYVSNVGPKYYKKRLIRSMDKTEKFTEKFYSYGDLYVCARSL